MNTWVLVIFLVWGNGGGPVALPYFSSQESCKKQAAIAMKENENIQTAFCVETDSKLKEAI